MRGNRLHVDQTKRDKQKGAALARGGKDRMFGEQQANPDRPGTTGKPDVRGPGAKSAKGGGKVNVGGRSVPAKPGATGPR
jgi:hypothetical protein